MSFGHGSALAPSSGMSAQSFYRKVLLEAGRPSLDDAKRVTGAVFRRLPDGVLGGGGGRAGEPPRPVKLHRKAFSGRVRREAGLASEREARQATNVVFAALKGQLSPGEADDILAQLPKDLKAVWEDA